LIFCEEDQIPMAEFTSLLRNTSTLKELDVNLFLTENRLIAEGMGANLNRSLDSLSLATPTHGQHDEVPATGSVLYHLTNHACLRHLRLFGLQVENDMQPALSYYLARAPALKHLCFSSVIFDKNWTKHVVDDLAARKMIQKLEFEFCFMDDEATSVLEALAATDDDDEPKIQVRHLEVNNSLPNPDVQRRANETPRIANGSIYRTLLAAGMQAWRFVPNSVLMGVMAMCESISRRKTFALHRFNRILHFQLHILVTFTCK
jgi:hypothetical protein